MRLIVKGSEPKALQEYRIGTPNANYDGFSDRDALREALIQEQKGICAYCMQRISNEWDNKSNKYKTEIEHYKSQDTNLELALVYQNMLGVCNGNQGNPQHLLHCDKSKDTETNKKYLPLTVNPLVSHSVDKIQYRKNGEIYSEDELINRDLNIVLNLNQQNLKENRKRAIDAVYKELERRNAGAPWKISIIQKVKEEWEESPKGVHKPFCQAAIYFLDKLIHKLSKQ